MTETAIYIQNILYCPGCGNDTISPCTVNLTTFVGECDECGFVFDAIEAHNGGIYGTGIPQRVLRTAKSSISPDIPDRVRPD